MIGLLGLLVLQLRYSAALADASAEVVVLGVRVYMDQVPLPAFLSTTWTFLAVLVLRYYQSIAHVDKQYTYIHRLEHRLSTALGGKELITRESDDYFTQKGSWLRHWTWRFYTSVFPGIVMVTIAWSGYTEWGNTDIPLTHKLYDSVLGLFVIGTLICYLVSQWFER